VLVYQLVHRIGQFIPQIPIPIIFIHVQ